MRTPARAPPFARAPVAGRRPVWAGVRPVAVRAHWAEIRAGRRIGRSRIQWGRPQPGASLGRAPCRAAASWSDPAGPGGREGDRRRIPGWGLILMGAVELVALMGTVGGAVAVLVGCDAALGVLPVVLPFVSLIARQWGERARAKVDRDLLGVSDQLVKQESLIANTSDTVAKLQSEMSGKSARRLLMIEGKLGTLEAALLSTGQRMREAVSSLQGLSRAFRDGAQLQYQASVYGVRRELQEALQQWTAAQTEAVQALSNRILLLEDTVRMVEANQADTWGDVSEGLRSVIRTKEDVASLSTFVENELAGVLNKFEDSLAQVAVGREGAATGTVSIDPQQWSSLGVRLRYIENRLSDLTLQLQPEAKLLAEGNLTTYGEPDDLPDGSMQDEAADMGAGQTTAGVASVEGADNMDRANFVLEDLAREIRALKVAVELLRPAKLLREPQTQEIEQPCAEDAVAAEPLTNENGSNGEAGPQQSDAPLQRPFAPESAQGSMSVADRLSGIDYQKPLETESVAEGVADNEEEGRDVQGNNSVGMPVRGEDRQKNGAENVIAEQQWVQLERNDASVYEEAEVAQDRVEGFFSVGSVSEQSVPRYADGSLPQGDDDRFLPAFGADYPDDPPRWLNGDRPNESEYLVPEPPAPWYSENYDRRANYDADYPVASTTSSWTTSSQQVENSSAGVSYSSDQYMDTTGGVGGGFPRDGYRSSQKGAMRNESAGMGPIGSSTAAEGIGSKVDLEDSVDRTRGDAPSTRIPDSGVADGLAQLKEGRAAMQYDLGTAHQLLCSALGYFEDVLQATPEDRIALGNSGNTLLALGDLKIKMAEAMTSKGSMESGKQAMQEADEILTLAGQRFRQLLMLDKEDQRAYMNWGKALCTRAQLADSPELSDKLYAAAIAKYSQVLSLSPDSASAFLASGVAHRDWASTKSARSPEAGILAERAAHDLKRVAGLECPEAVKRAAAQALEDIPAIETPGAPPRAPQ
ncbi:unnamed protein product [Ostreobium quekettii]|uniref:Uncharacterized protein n=1 Tax=Ostreobium quekettii TaxID=121088 RepID=A0A8S1IN50_9CHLO|nr:unnamed protein product [Ostreobium quekettii]|eukprot:evm.model.scf_249.10 EVM.evm.TU.scf_249.10   scf_249:69077-77165(+)